MARENFAACMAEIYAHEGGYVDHPKDPGGATNMGITKATLEAWRGRKVSKQEVKDLPRSEADRIYRSRYWNPVRGDDLNHGIDLVTFDPAVNSGVGRGVIWLQRALGVAADGKMGPVTLSAVGTADPQQVIARACTHRMGFLRGLKTWGTFGKGWSRRVARVEAVAIRMVTEAANRPARPVLLENKAKAQSAATREAQGAGGVAAGVGGVTTLADLPEWALVAVGLALVIVVLNLLGRRQHEQDRAAAFQAVAEEARP